MLGSASIISAPTAPETLVLSVCSSGASAETFDRLADLADGQLDGHADGFRRGDGDAGALERGKARERDGDRVGAGLEVGRREEAVRCRHEFGGDVGRFVGDDDRGARHDGLLTGQ